MITNKIQNLKSNLTKLTAKFKKTTNKKLRYQQKTKITTKTIKLTNKLIKKLTSKNIK